jgi:hypothetical protein
MSTPSPTILDTLETVVTVAYAQALGVSTVSDIADNRLLVWCLDEIASTYDPLQSNPAAAFTNASEALRRTIQDIQAMIDAIEAST